MRNRCDTGRCALPCDPQGPVRKMRKSAVTRGLRWPPSEPWRHCREYRGESEYEVEIGQDVSTPALQRGSEEYRNVAAETYGRDIGFGSLPEAICRQRAVWWLLALTYALGKRGRFF